jgi:serine/threonine protein kinase
MRWLSDAAVDHLCQVADWPDLSGTRYDVVTKLAQGGMASVYLATDRALDRPVALKILSDTQTEPQAALRMAAEARILGRLEHPGIVPVHDVGVLPDGRTYYVMKYVRGQRLDEHVSSASPLAARLRIFEKICDAVAFAHAHGVIHRDLKPQNIMVGSFGEVLVMDWGLAKVLGKNEEGAKGEAGVGVVPLSALQPGSAPGQTQVGVVMGTPGYMAPEQARGEVDQIDERTDVYGLGAVLYFLLTGRPPVSLTGTATPVSLPPRQHNRAIPRALEAICLKALAAEPAHRYSSVAELAKDIAYFLAERRVEAYPEGILEAAKRVVSKYRAAVVLVLAYLVMRILLLLWTGA